MKRITGFRAGVFPLLAALFLACGGGSTPRRDESPKLVSIADLERIPPAEISSRMNALGADRLQLSHALGGHETVAQALLAEGADAGTPRSLTDIWEELYKVFSASVKYVPLPRKVVFQRTPTSPRETGLLVVPVATGGKKFPMLSLQHPTQVERQFSPSRLNLKDNQLTTQYALLLGSMGYIVCAPDYPGMGDNTEVHPYCLNSLGTSVTAMILAVQQGENVPWDGRLFLMGYSEGGYATLVAAKEIQAKHADLNLVAVAPLDGPHSLSGTMRDLMITADSFFVAPFFLPYVIAGYGTAYPRTSELVWANAVLNDPPGFSAELYKRLGGDYTGKEISDCMRTVPGYKGPITITRTAFRDAIKKTGSDLNQRLAENDSFAGWTPRSTVKISLWHHTYDDLVPANNTRHVAAEWSLQSNVRATYFLEMIPALGSVHAGALVPALIKGTAWLNDQAVLDAGPEAQR